MGFVTALALLVGLLVAAPVAAHLLRRRYAEEQSFPAAHLVPATRPAARRRSALEDRTLFAVRALSIAALALLGATPLLRCSHLSFARQGGASIAMVLVLDDSLSMRAPLPSGQGRFERAVEGARQLARGLAPGDAAAVVLAGSPPRVALASTTNLAAVDDALDGLTPSDRSTDLDGALALAHDLLEGLQQVDKRVVLFSDLADGAPDGPPLGRGGDVALWVPLPELVASGDDCAVLRAERTGRRARVRVACTGPVAAGRWVEIRSKDAVLARVELDAGLRSGELVAELPEQAPDALTAALTGSDAIGSDDVAPLAPAGGPLSIAVVADQASTQVVTGGPPPLEQALAALELDAEIRPLPEAPESPEALGTHAALVVDDAPGFTPEVRRAVVAWVERGGVAMLTLGPRAAAAPLGASFDPLVPGVVRWGPSPVQGIDTTTASLLGGSAASLEDVAPRGRASLEPVALETPAEVLVRWQDGAPLLLRRPLGRGVVLASTLPFSTEESDLVLRPAFLTLLEQFVSTARARGGARRIEAGETWTFDGYRDVKVGLVNPGDGERREPVPVVEVDRRLRAMPGLAGLYELTLDGERSSRVVSIPEREIDLRPRRVEESASAASLGGVGASVDASPHVALVLLGLVTLELLLRLLGRTRLKQEAAAEGGA
ncbi:vWA domain-containing protein [Chondromyces crocatus]|uniref:VWFA domain-containing protein n=1 Tax=Chondromyces crocatus TaxID=52 RepID=A0A0K1E9P4_CHOCO|nr:VWA domain-containing protein [Chondromyces crocatus]AKT37412.1 uncharacterized protein CMC5_015530 [Chondromyces crocatus]